MKRITKTRRLKAEYWLKAAGDHQSTFLRALVKLEEELGAEVGTHWHFYLLTFDDLLRKIKAGKP